MTDGSHTAPGILYMHTCIYVPCSVLVGLYISSLIVIMPLRKVQRFALEEEDSRFGIIVISCGCSV